MKGKCNYNLPNKQTYEAIFLQNVKKQKQEFVSNLVKNDTDQQGTMYVIDQDNKINKKLNQIKDPVKEYVKNFGNTADMIRNDGKG